MKSIQSIFLLCSISLITSAVFAKKPKHEKQTQQQNVITYPKERTDYEDDEESQLLSDSHHYHPNPVILQGVGQIMNGALQIAQNPHSRPNVGHSIASMLHGIMSIIVEKVAKKKVDINDPQAIAECLAEIDQEITEIIITKQSLLW